MSIGVILLRVIVIHAESRGENKAALLVSSFVIGGYVWRGVIGGEINPKGLNSLTIQRTHLTINTFLGHKATKPA